MLCLTLLLFTFYSMEGDGKSPVHIELYVTGIPMELTEVGQDYGHQKKCKLLGKFWDPN